MSLAIATGLIATSTYVGSSSNATALPPGPLPRTFTAGAYIVDLGQPVQTVANGLKPYGLVYDLVINKRIPVSWAFSDTKLKDGVDFAVGAKNYSGSAFIIPAAFAVEALPTINSWKAKGVVVDGPTTTTFTAPEYEEITSFPKSVLDLEKGSLAVAYYTKAEIPASSYRVGTPASLNSCDDLYVMPHADPTWATHSNLIPFNQRGGYIWAGCHAVSVLENVDDPGDPGTAPNMNFLSTNGLIPFGSHSAGTPPYTYDHDGHPVAQFLGTADAAQQGGSERIYFPSKPGDWRATTKVIAYDATPAPADAASSGGKAGTIIIGPGFGNPSNGQVMYEGGHSLDGTAAPNVAAIRAFFDFQLLAGIAAALDVDATIPANVDSGATVPVSVTASGGSGSFTYQWTSSCGGTFASATSAATTFTAPTAVSNTPCNIKVVVSDTCGRVNFDFQASMVAPPQAADIGITKTINKTSPIVDEIVTYTITARNDLGPGDATGVTVADTLPAGLTMVSATPSRGTFSGGVWTVGALAFGSTATLQIQARVNSGTGGSTIVNSAAISSTSVDPSSTNNSASVSLRVNQVPVALPDSTATPESTPVTIPLFANDSVGDGPITITANSDPGHGTVTINPTTGQAIYSPTPGFNGVDTFTYSVTDANNDTSTTTVTITVSSVDDPPVAANDSNSTLEDTGVNIDVLANDSDLDGNLDPATLRLVGAPPNGTVTLNPDNTFAYQPNPNFFGIDTFTYEVCDSATPRLCDTATVAVTVNAANDPVAPGNDSASTYEDAPINIAVLDNDSDVEGLDRASLTIDSAPTNGSVAVLPDGTITYTPNANYSGTDTFTYRVCDNSTPASCATADVTVMIAPVEDPPVATNDTATTPEDVARVVNLLANDTRGDRPIDPTSVTITAAPANGTVAIDAAGNATYTPNDNFHGTDTFRYQLCDSGTPVLCADATATVTITSVNDPVVAADESAITSEDAPVKVTILGNDTDPDANIDLASLAVINVPANGIVTVNGDHTLTYTPASDFSGTNQFTYQICDTGTPVYCDLAVVSVTVNPTNDPPVAGNDSASTPEDQSVVVNIGLNDSDVEGPLNIGSYAVVAGPSNGTVVGAGSTYTYTPNSDFAGTDTFTYQVCDTGSPSPALCTTANATITVTPVNDPPVAQPETVGTPESTAITITVLGNDTDPDANISLASVAIVAPPVNGSVVVNPDGTLQYTPTAGFSGVDVLTYRVCDSGTPSLCDTAVVTIAVAPVNDPPNAVNDTVSTNEDAPLLITVATNDTDPDLNLNPPSVTIVANATNGTTSVDPMGRVLYTPADDFNGSDTFQYRICDLGSPIYCDVANVQVTINPANDEPVLTADAASTPEDSPVTIGVLSNDGDVDSNLDPSSLSVVSGPAHGTVTVNPDRTITYTPAGDYASADSFSYEVCDTGSPIYCRTAIVTITVNPVNDGPAAIDDSATTPEDMAVAISLLSNDADTDGSLNPATLKVLSQPTSGSVVINPLTAAAIYLPNSNFHGSDSFTYEVCDNGTPVLCAQAVATVTVTPSNDPPVPAADSASTPEDTPVALAVLSNDGDPDLNVDPASVSVTAVPANGSVSINSSTGVATYTPNDNFHGVDTFTYEICDTGTPVFCGTAVGTVLVASVPDAPVAVVDSRFTPEDTAVIVAILGNDVSVDGPLSPASVRVTSVPSNGTVSVNSTTGTVTYTPNENWSGIDTFTYEVCTSTPVLCDSAVVTITVTAVNDSPILANDAGSTPEDTAIAVAVLTNDTDVEGPLNASSLAVTSSPTNGSVTIQPDSKILYMPALNFAGSDTLTYTVCDSASPASCSTAVVLLTVTPIADPPSAVVDSVVTPEETPIEIDVLSNDLDPENNIDPNSVSVTAAAANGTLSVDAATGKVTYTPALNFNGNDTFTYQVCDLGSPVQCDTAAVTIVVNPVNDPPVAENDTVTTPEDLSVTVSVLTNDTDVDANLDRTTVSITVAPTNGLAVVNTDATITYTPSDDYSGTDTITYRVCDTGSPIYCDTAVINVGVTPVNDAPTAIRDIETTPEDTPVDIAAIGNDSDLEGSLDPTSVSVTTPAATGTTSVHPTTGVITYTPNLDFVGEDTFFYSVCDPGSPVLCATAAVTVTVTAKADPPVPGDDTDVTSEDQPVTIAVLSNDTDPESNLDMASVSVSIAPLHGTATANADGTITYTPNPNFTGNDVFTYQVCDTSVPVLCATAEVIVIVGPVNDAPSAVDDENSTPEETAITVVVVGNDTDIDSTIDPTTVVITNPPSNGTAAVTPTGSVVYTPNTNFNGIDTFTYQVCDNGTPVLCDTATVTIDVTGVNDPPVANDEAIDASAETPAVVSILNNDSDIDANLDPSSVTIDVAPGHGTVLVNPDGTIEYTPAIGYLGADTLTYRVCDTGSPVYCDTAVVTFAVATLNLPPVAVNDTLSTRGGVVNNVTVLVNDTDPNNNIVSSTVTVVGQPANGTATANPDGTIKYTADTNYIGTDLVTYQVCDSGKPTYCTTALLEVMVTETATPPVAKPDSAATSPITPVTFDLIGNDFAPEVLLDPASVKVTAQPKNGRVTIDPASGAATYTPDEGFAGTDTFTYSVCDKATKVVRCTTAVATIAVTKLNLPPIAEPDFASTPQSTPVTMNVVGNDRDPDGSLIPSTLLVLTQPPNGSVVAVDNGNAIYTPNAGFVGVDTTTYQICDNGNPSMCASSTGTITVTPVNLPIVADPDVAVTLENTPVTIAVLSNDRDPDGKLDAASVSVVAVPANGNVTVQPDGSMIYTPKAGFTGVDTFVYRVCNSDTPSLCTETTVTVTVGALEPKPELKPDATSTLPSQPVTFSVIGNDVGNLDPKSVKVTSKPAHGTAQVNPDGTITYSPLVGFVGVDTFTYEVCDAVNKTVCASTIATIDVPFDDTARNKETSGVGGRLFDDRDRDQKQSSDEVGLEGAKVELLGAGPDGKFGTPDDFRVSTVTDAKGDFLFDGLPPGKYELLYPEKSGELRVQDNSKVLLDLKPGTHRRTVAVLPYELVATPSLLAFTGPNAIRTLVLMGFALIGSGSAILATRRRRSRSR